MSNDSIPVQFRTVAERFRRINAPDDATAERLIKIPATSAMQCVKRAVDAGLLTFPSGWDVPWPEQSVSIMADDTGKWVGRWIALVVALSRSYPDELPQNPLAIKIKTGSGSSVGISEHKDWRWRAESFAITCEWLANFIERADSGHRDVLSQFISERLGGDLNKGMAFIVSNGCNVALADLAFKLGWESPYDNQWSSFRRRILEKWNVSQCVANVSFTLNRSNNHAILKISEAVAPDKKRRSAPKVKSTKRTVKKKQIR